MMQVQVCVYAHTHTHTHTHKRTHVCACVTYSGNYSHSAHFNSTSKLPPPLYLLILPSPYFYPSLSFSSFFALLFPLLFLLLLLIFLLLLLLLLRLLLWESRKKLLNFTQDFCCSRSVPKFFDCCRFI